MTDMDREALLDRTGSIYKLVLLTAIRAGELGDGATKLVETKHDEKPINIALQEILEGKVTFKIKEKK